MEVIQAAVTIIGAGGAGAIFTIFTQYLISKRKLSQGHDLKADKQQHDHLTETIERQAKRIMQLETMLAEQAQRHDEYMATAVGERVRSARMEGEMIQLKEAIKRSEAVRVVGNVVVDSKGIIVDWDTGASTIFNWTANEAIGQHLSILMPQRFIEEHATSFKAVVAKEHSMREAPLDTMGKKRSGAEVPITIVLSEAWGEEGQMRIGASIRSR
jgi:PAS domain S-box-containing protein